MLRIKWSKNEGSIELPGLHPDHPVQTGEWSGYVNGMLNATIHRSNSGKLWFPLVKMSDGTVEQAGAGMVGQIVAAKSRARHWPRITPQKVQAAIRALLKKED